MDLGPVTIRLSLQIQTQLLFTVSTESETIVLSWRQTKLRIEKENYENHTRKLVDRVKCYEFSVCLKQY